MKIPSATGFTIVCTTELAFEYLKQTVQMKLIVPFHLTGATRAR